MHITLGVMDLTEEHNKDQLAPADEGTTGGQNSAGRAARPRTVQSAIELLNKLRPRIMDEIAGEQLRIGLRMMDIMRPERGDLSKAHVMWAGPSHEDEQAKRLKRVAELVNKEFRKAGLVIDERRPLKLHCTVINTSHRKGRRQPFSYADVLASSAFRGIEQQVEAGQNEVGGAQATRGKKPIAIDLGEWSVDELQICEMGSWGPEGEYVAVGKIPLR